MSIERSSAESLAHKLIQDVEQNTQRLRPTELSEEEANGGIAPGQEWEALEALLQEERRRKALDLFRAEQKALIRHRTIREWVDEHLATERATDRSHLVSEIGSRLKADELEELIAYLTDALECGIDEARVRSKRRAAEVRKRRQRSAYPLYAWAVVKGVVRVGVAFGLFSLAKTEFETAVIALLVISYLSVYYLSARNWLSLRFGLLEVEARFAQLHGLMKLRPDEAQRDRQPGGKMRGVG